MERNIYINKKRSELRLLSMKADKANIGLELALSGEIDKSLLDNGVEFCDSVLAGLDTEELKQDNSQSINFSKSAVLKNTAFYDDIKEVGINQTNIRDSIVEIKSNIIDIIDNNDVSNEKIVHLQKLLFSISMLFFSADIIELRQRKERNH